MQKYPAHGAHQSGPTRETSRPGRVKHAAVKVASSVFNVVNSIL